MADRKPGFFRFPSARLCAVLGKPVSHSKSPRIHREFAEQFGLALQYERIETSLTTLGEMLDALRAMQCSGVNVTVPLKEEAAALCAHLLPMARVAGAANTLWWDEDGALCGDNTDGVGLLADLERNWGVSLQGQRVVVLGAGGAAAGIIPTLLDSGHAEVFVHNRDPGRAAALAKRFQDLGAVCVLPDRPIVPADLIINATSAGLHGTVPAFPSFLVGDNTGCYDLSYSQGETPFLGLARRLGARSVRDGHGMLVEQAAAAFVRWHGHTPSTAQVLAGLAGPLKCP